MIEVRRGDVVLVAFPLVAAEGSLQQERRPALVVQADRYNRRRAVVIQAAIASARSSRELPCKVFVTQNSAAGRMAGLWVDSIVDCQTLVTIPLDLIPKRLGRFPAEAMLRVESGLRDALGPHPPRSTASPSGRVAEAARFGGVATEPRA
ncbi:MAG: type II toxin-antitoxin system PemK/MazF family toxin [Planctomycetes bacterium]|nr:type II toxin-antitoxin system PemK/MazF family toxin [Planctomycetota bacterium]